MLRVIDEQTVDPEIFITQQASSIRFVQVGERAFCLLVAFRQIGESINDTSNTASYVVIPFLFPPVDHQLDRLNFFRYLIGMVECEQQRNLVMKAEHKPFTAGQGIFEAQYKALQW